ncbi:MAG: MFS transporter [Micromonosporaceae bacterium]
MTDGIRAVTGQARRGAHTVRGLASEVAGGPAQARMVLVLAAVLGLNGADAATISATANNLERAFHIGNTAIGLLVSVVALAGAVCTVPFGILADRTQRTRLLAGAVVLWSVATVSSGAATSYQWLLGSRVFLGAVSAAAGPVVASLTGDFFPAGQRGRIYGMILAGELAGTGAGFIISGDISSVLSWRYAFWWLALPSLALAWVVWKLPEPARGGQSRLPDTGEDRDELAQREVSRAGVEPQAELVLHSDPAPRSLWWAVRYVLRVRTNVVIIIASGLGYFYFAGLRSFAIIFATRHYELSKAAADSFILVVGVGAIAGVFAGGRVADRLLRRGNIRARVLVPSVCLLGTVPLLAGAIAATPIAIAIPLLTLGAGTLGAANPPLDAARLDVMHPRLWGRAESIRTVLRTLGEAAAPALFGYMSQYVFGSRVSASTGGESTGGASTGGGGGGHAAGLEYTFLLFLLTLLAAGLLALVALRTYPRDVATARASLEATSTTAADPGDGRG